MTVLATISGLIEPAQLRKFGPLIPASWSSLSDEKRTVQGMILIDTGANGAMIDEAVAKMIGAEKLGERKIHGAHGNGQSNHYLARFNIQVVTQEGHRSLMRFPLECTGIPGLQERMKIDGLEGIGILGRNFLQFCDLRINGVTGEVLVLIDRSILLPRSSND